MDIKQIQQLSNNEMLQVNALIQAQLTSDVALINQLGFYIVNSGGKRIRPLITILAAKALDIHNDKTTKLAAIIEFIHTATLLHDDVVDESDLRRGEKTANALFGNAASVLVGDFLYTRSFQMMTDLQNLKVMDVLSNATNVIAEGEVLQLMNCNDPDTTEKSYMDVIYFKTAKLFEAATQLVAVLGEQPTEIEQALLNYGKYLGTAFQLTDDVMDYNSDASEMGKNTGDDLAEGKPTLPLLYAMQHGNETQVTLIRDAIEKGNGMDHFDDIMQALKETNALSYTQQRALEEADKAIAAISILPENDYKQALISLAHLAANRKN
ncbi:octaprenyl diphosphate synthase [Psychromonas sp. psych-6C06]|uniref:octaprenyl diphosphate synthase n=1 Tax=Psychromonas sp. psych-6C06 TaxID=2058089 RepID=UPI000C33D317|nr:octaprenyl diphosphate synthase [Psychromonas sp. psych-6C06]PKF61182.1 octaprenyl diphosphate synthase [Psychromonas sp. psych-6C06]